MVRKGEGDKEIERQSGPLEPCFLSLFQKINYCSQTMHSLPDGPWGLCNEAGSDAPVTGKAQIPLSLLIKGTVAFLGPAF